MRIRYDFKFFNRNKIELLQVVRLLYHLIKKEDRFFLRLTVPPLFSEICAFVVYSLPQREEGTCCLSLRSGKEVNMLNALLFITLLIPCPSNVSSSVASASGCLLHASTMMQMELPLYMAMGNPGSGEDRCGFEQDGLFGVIYSPTAIEEVDLKGSSLKREKKDRSHQVRKLPAPTKKKRDPLRVGAQTEGYATNRSYIPEKGNTLHVPGDYSTIQRAIHAAQPGDTVLVAPQTYVENIDFLGKAITVMSSDGPNVTTLMEGRHQIRIGRAR